MIFPFTIVFFGISFPLNFLPQNKSPSMVVGNPSNDVNEGHFENAVIKLCVRLEATLKYKYKYEGDLFTMMDAYALQHLQWRNAWDDDYDGANEEADYKKEMLHKLRLVRNGIVHAEKNNVNFNNDDLYRCIEIVEKI